MPSPVARVYGFEFPDEFRAFADFWKRHGRRCECLGVAVDGPFAVLQKKKVDPGGDWPRFYRDPPEFFTVMIGDTDGLHWGYWFDDPDDAEREPVVASYHANDAFELTMHESLFAALRYDLELSHRDAEDYRVDDPENAADYDARLAAYAELRAALGEYALKERRETGRAYADRWGSARTGRKPVAPTRHRMGIVVPKKSYRPLGGQDPFAQWNYAPKVRDVKKMDAEARSLAEAGAPGAALKLGQDLWGYNAFLDESAALLDLAYVALGRETLRRYLEQAVAFRRKCDAARR